MGSTVANAVKVLVICSAAGASSSGVEARWLQGFGGGEPVAALLEVGSGRHLSSVMANMTTELALRTLSSGHGSQLDRVLRGAGAAGKGSFLQAREDRTRVSAASGAPSALLSQDPSATRPLLNEMMSQSTLKLDAEQLTCAENTETSSSEIESAVQDMKQANAQGTANRARVLFAQDNIAAMSTKLPSLAQDLDVHKAKCQRDEVALRAQIGLIRGDHATLADMVSSTRCAPATTLIQCRRHRHSHDSFLAFGHRGLQRKAGKLRSHTARRALQHTLGDVYKTGQPVDDGEVALVQIESNHRRLRHHARRHSREHSRHGHRHSKHMELLGNRTEAWWNSAHCITAESPDCEMMRERFLLMQTGVAEKKEDLEDQAFKLQQACAETRANYKAQMDDLNMRLKDQQTILALATKVVVQSEEQSRLRQKQLSTLQDEHKRSLFNCQKNIDALANEICGAKQIRGELYKMNMDRTFIQDCTVSAWLPEVCSATCGGGTMRMTRTVVVPPTLGMACPPLAMERTCNEQDCPIDCEVESWSAWSACSAPCGGGVRQRIRGVTRNAQNDGRPCGSTSESASCHLESCDQECELAPWSEWSTCSKACDSGFVSRVRSVSIAAVGSGACPNDQSPKRLQYKRCNTHVCEPAHGDILECHAKLDVVLLLDGSASLGDEGWEAMKTASAEVVRAFKSGEDEAQVALLLFSGPDNWADYERCTSGTAQDVDMDATCKISWASHFTTDTDALATQMGALVWPKATSLTSAALATAEAELGSGRKNAPAVVIVMTDGQPMNKRATYQAAVSLRKKARLIWVPVTRNAPLSDIKEWASRPVADNVAAIESFEDLTEPRHINRIIADACPRVE